MHVHSSVQKCYKLHWWFTWALVLELCPSQTLAINVSVGVAASRNTLVEGRAPETARRALRTGGASKAGIGGTVHRLMDWFYMCRADMMVLMTSQDTQHMSYDIKDTSHDVTWCHMTAQWHYKCLEQLTLWGRTRGSGARCVTEAFSSAYVVHIENCEGGWFSGGIGKYWKLKARRPGSIHSNYCLFTFLHFASYM